VHDSSASDGLEHLVSKQQVDAPPFWTHEEWCEGFLQFLDHLRLDQASALSALSRRLPGILMRGFGVSVSAPRCVFPAVHTGGGSGCHLGLSIAPQWATRH